MVALKSTRTLASTLSVYQLSVLHLLSRGVELCMNEGHNYRVWLETERGNELKFKLLKRTVEVLHTQGLLVTFPDGRSRLPYRYRISQRGRDVLYFAPPQVMAEVHAKIGSTLAASIACPRSD